MLSWIKSSITKVNGSIEEAIGPEQRSCHRTYDQLLASSSPSRALHLGAGRDKEGKCSQIPDESGVIAFDMDREGLSRNDTGPKIQGDAITLPFDDESFDLVFTEMVFEHLAQPWEVLAEIDRILALGGSLLILVPNPLHYYAKIADLTPFWFHELWLRFNGHDTTDIDAFPTEYEWGRLSQLLTTVSTFEWSITELHSFPGPTSYTRRLPFHAAFVLLDRFLARFKQFHVLYIVQYEKQGRSSTTP